MAGARTIQQTGVVSPGHAVSWVAPGIAQDAGSSVSGQINSLGLYGNGGLPFIITNSPTPGPFSGIYAQFGAGISSAQAYLNVNTFGAAALPLSFQINGTTVFSIGSGGAVLAAPLPVASGGTGLATIPANGQMLIGNGTGYALSTLTAGLNVSIANTAGGVTISSSVGPSGVLPTANGGTGTSAVFTAGSVVFAGGSGNYAQDNAALFWDDTNARLGISTAAPAYPVHARKASGDVGLTAQVDGSTGSDTATVRAISAGGTVTMQSVGNGNTFLLSSGTTLTIGTSTAAVLSAVTNGAERLRVNAAGLVLLNTASALTANALLSVNGSTATLGLESRSGLTGSFTGYRYNIDWTGSAANLWINSTNVGTFTLTSDYRVKKNVTSQPDGALARIVALRPVEYEFADYLDVMKADGVAREGFIAHEVAAVIPSAVEGAKDAEGQIQSLKLDALVSVLVKAVQELKAEFDAYKAAHP